MTKGIFHENICDNARTLDERVECALLELDYAKDDVTTSDLQGMAMVYSRKLMDVSFRDTMDNPELRSRLFEVENTMLEFVYEEIRLGDAIERIKEMV